MECVKYFDFKSIILTDSVKLKKIRITILSVFRHGLWKNMPLSCNHLLKFLPSFKSFDLSSHKHAISTQKACAMLLLQYLNYTSSVGGATNKFYVGRGGLTASSQMVGMSLPCNVMQCLVYS